MDMRKIIEKILDFRLLCLALVIIVTCFLGYQCFQLKLYDDPNRWPPKSHPNVVLNDYLQENFGGANLVTVQIAVKEGDIFNPETLAKVKRITEKIRLIYGVVPYALNSLSDGKTKYMKGTEDFLDLRPLLAKIPETPKEMEDVKYGVYHNPSIYGVLVSPDAKATIIVSDFRTGEHEDGQVKLPKTDPIKIYQEIQRIIEPENDENHSVKCTGSPIIIGWVNSEGLRYLPPAFLFFVMGMGIVLWFSFRHLKGVIFPLLLGLIVSIWAFGLYASIFGNILRSTSVFMVPFILMAATACHSVQFLKRFYDEEYPKTKLPKPAVANTFLSLFSPMLMALVTDFTGFLVLSIVPFDNVSLVGCVTALGLLSLVFCIFFFLPPLLSCFPSRLKEDLSDEEIVAQANFMEKWTTRAVEMLVGETRARWVLVGIVGVALILSLGMFPRLDIGQDNTYAIHNFLTKSWRNNPIYLMEMQIKERFGGVYPLNVLIDGKKPGAMETPELLKKIDKFATSIEKAVPEVAGSMSLPVYIKLMHRFFHNEDDNYFRVPDEQKPIQEYLYMYASGEPGGFDSVVDSESREAVLSFYLKDTRHETVRKSLAAVKDYARKHFNDDKVEAKIAGGAIGLAGAFNENIGKWLVMSTLLSALASYICVLLLSRSFLAGLFFLLPLFVGTVIWLAVMKLTGIEINSNTTTSAAIAMGVGIDAEIYFFFRFREEFAKMRDFKDALIQSFTKIRKALIFSHLALIFGCWALIPIPLYVGYVGYGMGMILLICFLVSFILTPFLWSIFRPRFLIKGF